MNQQVVVYRRGRNEEGTYGWRTGAARTDDEKNVF